MPPDSDGKELAKSREQFTVVCNLRKLFHDETHADKIDAWVCKAHSMTRLALIFQAPTSVKVEKLRSKPRHGVSFANPCVDLVGVSFVMEQLSQVANHCKLFT